MKQTGDNAIIERGISEEVMGARTQYKATTKRRKLKCDLTAEYKVNNQIRQD